MIEGRSVNICYIQDTRFRGKAAEYKLFWIGNEKSLVVGTFLAKKWVDKDIGISCVNDTMIDVQVQIQSIFILVISIYALQFGFDDSQKDGFYGSLINVVGKLGEKKTVVIAGDLNDHIEVTQKTKMTSRENTVMELETRKGKGFLSFVQL